MEKTRTQQIENAINEVNMLLLSIGVETNYLGHVYTPTWDDVRREVMANIAIIDNWSNKTDDQYNQVLAEADAEEIRVNGR